MPIHTGCDATVGLDIRTHVVPKHSAEDVDRRLAGEVRRKLHAAGYPAMRQVTVLVSEGRLVLRGAVVKLLHEANRASDCHAYGKRPGGQQPGRGSRRLPHAQQGRCFGTKERLVVITQLLVADSDGMRWNAAGVIFSTAGSRWQWRRTLCSVLRLCGELRPT